MFNMERFDLKKLDRAGGWGNSIRLKSETGLHSRGAWMMSRALSGNGKIKGVPLATEPGISLVILLLIRILQRNLKRTTDTFLFISHTTNVLLFKFRCNIFIGVRIIKEMPGSVASGTHCIRCNIKKCIFYGGGSVVAFGTTFVASRLKLRCVFL